MGYPDWGKQVITSAPNAEQKNSSISDADTTVSFSQEVKAWIVYNDGPNPVHINWDAAATTTNFKIPSKSWLMLDKPTTDLHFICASGESATVYCIGVY